MELIKDEKELCHTAESPFTYIYRAENHFLHTAKSHFTEIYKAEQDPLQFCSCDTDSGCKIKFEEGGEAKCGFNKIEANAHFAELGGGIYVSQSKGRIKLNEIGA